MSDKIPLGRQIKCVEREIALREFVYPRRVGAGKMTELKAADEIAAMEAVLETLKALQEKERT